MKLLKPLAPCAALFALSLLASCSNAESYANLLEDENKDVNRFLADHRVEASIPEDGQFEVGPNAPYYVIDDENGVYMQVLDPGDLTDRAKEDQEIYFHYMSAPLKDYQSWNALSWSGNAEDLGMGTFSFRFENYSIPSSYQWGTGLQQPLKYLGLGCRVYLVVKSLAGIVAIQSEVIPYIFDITYNKSQLSGTGGSEAAQ